MILVDTSFLIRALVKATAEDKGLRQWLAHGEPIAASTIGWAEFLCGPLDPAEFELAATIVADRIPFLDEDAAMAARFFNDTGRRRGTLIDCMIAATAIRIGASLATANPKDFKKVAPFGLELAAY